jgi:hypothetical protein
VLAYVFWHRPRSNVEVSDYEERLRSFHGALDFPSGSFRLIQFPFGEGGGYEDWYLVDSWAELGELNKRAVDTHHRSSHERVALGAADGWGGIYDLVRGMAEIPRGTEWLDKPQGELTQEFIATLPHPAVWRRQLVLGPGPEFCCAVAASNRRARI